MERLKLAVQKDGRMTQGSLALLERCGLELEYQSRVLVSPCLSFPLDLLSMRDDDIPEYVEKGVSDIGIVGENVLREKGAEVQIIERLGFSRCQLSLAVPRSSGWSKIQDLEGKRIATSYPQILSQFLAQQNVQAEIVEISGAVEIAPTLGLADAICDLISTGNTARLNNLEVMCPVLSSEAVLVANRTSLVEKKELIDKLLLRIRSTQRAQKLKYLMMNAPVVAVPKIREWLPGLKNPSIMPLTDPEMVAIHSVVSDDVLWDVIAKVKAAGATDLVALTVDSLIP